MFSFSNYALQGMEQAINSIDAFVGDAVLQGQTYDSAKAFFAQTFRPLAQGIICLCEELIRQNDAFPNDFQSQVASTDVIEQEILEQIREIERTKAGIEVISSTLPGMQVMVNIFDAMKRKLQEKLEHLHEFNYTSSSNYDTALQLAARIAQGLAEVQSGKGFNAASGTFSTQGLNMGWTASIQKITEDKARQAEKLKTEMSDSNSEKSMLKKVWDGIYYGSGQAVGDIVEGFKSLDDTVTKENIKYAIGHPVETLSTMWNALSDSFINDVINGDAESCTRWITYNFMGLGLGWLGDKGASKVSTLVKGTNFTKVTEITAPRLQQSFTNLTNDLNIENGLAFADTGEFNLKSSLNSTAYEAEEKLSTYQFASGENVTTVKPGDSSSLAPGGGLLAHKARGGHLIERHVGKTDAELLQRLARDPNITGSSTFTDRATAEKIAATVLNNPSNQVRIQSWLNNPRSYKLILRYNSTEVIGRGVRRGSTTVEDMSNARIVLKKDSNGGFILTGYPF
ncbi:cytoplasmic protein [Bacillus pseudomycoides]|nr:cytoplasmic protein [Bacillus pseudomycoides]